jgi:V/A-type H+-transporting ATPase subunit K
MIGAIISTVAGGNVFAETVTATAQAAGITMGEGFKYLAAALSTGLATIGTGWAVGSVGSSAVGAVSEDSSILGKTLIFVGMAEGIAIYGMIISILILFV